MVREQVLPNIEPAGKVRLPVRIEINPRCEQEHVCVRAEHGTRGARTCNLASNRLVEALQTLRLREVILQRAVNARQRVEIARQPAILVRHQPLEELCSLVRADSVEVSPGFFGPGSAGYHCLA